MSSYERNWVSAHPTQTMKAYYVEKLGLIRIFDYPRGTFGTLARMTDSPVHRNASLGCIELPGEDFRTVFVAAPDVEMSEAFEVYIQGIRERGVKVPKEDYWQSLLNGVELRPYQIEFLQWFEARRLLAYPPNGSQTGAILGLDMGLGKTLCSLAVNEHLRKIGLVEKTLIVCRMNNKYSTWAKHLNDYTNLEYVIVGGNRQKRLEQLDRFSREADVAIIHYEAARLHEKELRKESGLMLLADEAHKLANPASKQSKVLNTVSEASVYTLLLSGTIVQNRLATQLWHPLNICDRGVWPSFRAWKNTWCILDELWVPLYVKGKIIFDTKTHEPIKRRIHVISGIKNRKALSQQIAPYLYQKAKEEIAQQLPDKVYQIIEVGLNKEQLKLYKEIQEAVTNEVKGVSIPIALTKMLRMLQCCATLACFDMEDISRKADEVSETVIDTVPDGEQGLIFSRFVPMSHAVYNRLHNKGIGVLLLTGTEPKTVEGKEEIRRKFKEGGVQFLVTTMQLEGEGSDYPTVPYIFRCDRDWRPMVNRQAEDRCHRTTSTYKTLHVIDFVTRDSVETVQLETLQKKAQSIGDVMSLANLYTMSDIKRMLSVTPKAEW